MLTGTQDNVEGVMVGVSNNRRCLGFALLALVLLAATAGHAEDRRGAANALYKEGNALYAGGKYQQALDRYRRARALFPSFKLDLNIATSLYKLGWYSEAAPEFDAQTLWTSFTKLIATGIAWAIADWDRRLGREGEPSEDDFEPFILSMAERGRSISASEHLLAVQDAQRASRDVACFFGPHDLWLTPTLGTPPPPLGTFAYSPGGDPFELRRRMAEFSPFTYISNATGQPAASVPLHWSDDGLPIGVHFVGRYGDEATIFRIAAQLEEARPWAPRLSALRASWPRGDSQAMRRCMQ